MRMMYGNRRVILIGVICTIVVAVSIVVQVDYYRKAADESTHNRPINSMQVVDTSIEGSFFDKQTTPTTLPKKTNQISEQGITAQAYLVGNIRTGKIYLESHSTEVKPVASMSKLVTAFVVTDIMKGDDVVMITEEATKAPPDASNLQVGEKFKLKEILVPLLLNSSNVAAESIASTTNRARFLELMSSYAWEVGMPKSYFADPSGVDPHNAASARDLFGLAKYLVNYRPDILVITRTPEADIGSTTEHGNHHFTSTHPFVRDERFLGGKTGRTPEAGETMMTILNINGDPVAFIVLGSNYGYRETDTRRLVSKLDDITTGRANP